MNALNIENKEYEIILKSISNTLFKTGGVVEYQDINWHLLLDECKRQTVCYIVFEGLENKHAIPRDVYEKWFNYIGMYMRDNHSVNNHHSYLDSLMKKYGLPYCIYKGAASEFYYPNPALRAMGDVDFAVPKECFEKALDLLKDCDVLFHIGDVLYHGPRNDIPEGYNPKGLISKINSLDNIIIARGNCDADVDQMVINHPIQSPYVMSQFGETRIVTTHGYTDSKEDTINKAKSMGADILILGHTHVKELYLDENLVVLNPGSTSIPKDGTHSVAIIDIIQSEDEIDMNFNLIDINTKNIINLD